MSDPLGDTLSHVELIQVQGSDRMIAAAARVSYARDLDYDGGDETTGKDAKLLAYLLAHDHGSPFEHNLITFRVKAPLFVVQEMLRHRIGVSFNQQSGRYTEFLPEFYVPRVFRTQDAKNKQSSSGEVEHGSTAALVYKMACEASFTNYESLLRLGVAREQARGVLPHCTYTSLYITFNVRSLLHFLDLRLAPGAQWEIRQYAKVFEGYLEVNFPLTYAAWKASSG